MKISKSLFLAFAGLGLFACSNEDVTEINQFPEGSGAVSVKLVNPTSLSRTSDKTPGDAGTTTISITGKLIVSLYEETDLTKVAQTLTIDASSVNNDTELTFWNVTKPGKITVSINGGASDYTSTAINGDGMQNAPAGIPAYGETTEFTLTDKTGSPNIANDNDADTGNKQEQGADEGDQNKVYQKYSASVTMAIPVARLEVSGLTHVDKGTTCAYTTLAIKGVYMDSLYTQGGTYSTTDNKYSIGSNLVDYCWGKNNGLGTGETAILREEIAGEASERSFLGSSIWPKENDKAYAFNFYAGNENPVFKIYFDTSESSDDNSPLPAPRYAMITKYVNANGGGDVTFENGKIYRIISAELEDKNIIGDEGGNTSYGVVVTVKEATWSLVDVNAVWAE